jgi:serine protease Do
MLRAAATDNQPSMMRRCLLVAIASTGAVMSVQAGLPDLIDAASPSVVAVGTFDPLKSPRFTFRGTGFAVGLGQRVVTNAHVLPDPATSPAASSERLAVLVQSRPGQAPDLRMARVINSDPGRDLALLAIDGELLPGLRVAESASARVGTAVALIGYPLGTALGVVPVTHRGIISAVAAIALPPTAARQLDTRTLNRLRQGAFDIYQLDATAYPGNSGSPLLDIETGLVVGVVNMVFVKSTKESAIERPSGITYAIPIRYVSELLVAPPASSP